MARSWSPDADAAGALPVRLALAGACVAVALFAGPLVGAVAPGMLARHGGDALFVVRRAGLALGVALVCVAGFVRLVRSERFAARFVAPTTARDLAVLRIVIGAVTVAMIAVEPVPTTTRLPASLYEPVGFMSLFELVPGFSWARRESIVLALAWASCLATGMLATLGIRTRVTVPTAAVLALLLGGVLRSYTRVFHLGLLPALLLLVLAFTPCGDALSLEPASPARDGADRVARPRYAYGRFAVLANVAIAYAAAGFSKLVASGAAFWDPRNMHRVLFESALDPMAFDFDLPLRVRLPDALVSVMGFASVMIELAMPLVLVRGLRGRFLLPLAAIGMHLGILVFQNILFPDVLVLDAALVALLLTEREDVTVAPDVIPAATRAPWLVGLPLVVALAGIEAFPLTAWPMFSHADTSGVATYHRVHARTDTETVALDLTGCYPSMRDTRYRSLLTWAIDGARAAPSREALTDCARMQSRTRISPIRHVIVERVRYDFVRAPDHPTRGDVVARVVLPVSDSPSLIASGSTP